MPDQAVTQRKSDLSKEAVEVNVDAPSVEAKVAPRPHWITILLGFLSPGLALVALAMSYMSYQTAQSSLSLSQQSLQVGPAGAAVALLFLQGIKVGI